MATCTFCPITSPHLCPRMGVSRTHTETKCLKTHTQREIACLVMAILELFRSPCWPHTKRNAPASSFSSHIMEGKVYTTLASDTCFFHVSIVINYFETIYVMDLRSCGRKAIKSDWKFGVSRRYLSTGPWCCGQTKRDLSMVKQQTDFLLS